MHVGREGRDDQPLILVFEEDVRKAAADGAFRRGVARPLGIGGFTHEQQHALIADLADAGDVHHLAVHRGEIQLEVAGVEQDAERRADRDRAGVGNRVVDADKLRRELAELHGVAGLHGVQMRRMRQRMLGQLLLHDAERERRAVNIRVDRAQDVGQRADVILVSVRQKDAADLLLVLFEVGDVRDDQVNAQHIFVRECDAAVHDDDVVAVLDHGHVLADLVQTAERGDADLAGRPCAALAAAAALRRCRLHGLCGDGGCDRGGRCGCRRGLRLLRPSCVVPLCGLLFRRGGILRMLRGGVLIVFCHKFSFVSVLQTNTPRKKTCAGAKIKSVGNAVGQTKSKSIRRSKNHSGRVYVGLERTAERTGGHFTHIKTVQQLQKYYTPSAAGMQEGLRKRKEGRYLRHPLLSA